MVYEGQTITHARVLLRNVVVSLCYSRILIHPLVKDTFAVVRFGRWSSDMYTLQRGRQCNVLVEYLVGQ